MSLSIATWNINSVRARLDSLLRFIDQYSPDVICLQETKVADETFPLLPVIGSGYPHHALYGQKMYAGVAIFAKQHLPLGKVERGTWVGKADCRHLRCRLPGGIELNNFYVPSGGDVPDPAKNDKFDHKLKFMSEAAAWFKRRKRRTNRLVLVGDLNVAPLETDVWSHKQLLKVVSHTPIEVEHMQAWYDSHDWVDAVRHRIPPEENLYSWWSYRSPNWEAADKGRRLDHVWVTPALRDRIAGIEVVKDARAWPKASDHVPVIVTLDV